MKGNKAAYFDYSKNLTISFKHSSIDMTQCPACESEIPHEELYCPYCGRLNPSRKNDLLEKIENHKNLRNRFVAIFLLSMIAMWIFPSRNLVLLLSIISLGIALPTSIYYGWKKHQEEERLKEAVPR